MAISDTGAADTAEVQAAEDLVLTVYFEGLPEEPARQLSASGARHLIELLRAGDHQRFHSNIVLALGISGHTESYEALEWYGRDEPGEVGAGVYRGRLAVPIAMGHLARVDDRAHAWLARRARDGIASPRWSTARRRSEELADTLRSQILNGLAVSRRDDAAQLLEKISQGGRDPIAGAALELHQRLRAGTAARSGATP